MIFLYWIFLYWICYIDIFVSPTVVLDLWQQVMDVFAPWIQPLDNNGQILSPWIQNDIELATEMVAMFADALRELHANFEGKIVNILIC